MSDFKLEADPASREQVLELLESLLHVDKIIAILGHEKQVYISTVFIEETESFSLDFRNGGPHQHYTVLGQSRETVIAAFLSYFDDDDKWKTLVDWQRDSHYE
jgi:hypothetical protein